MEEQKVMWSKRKKTKNTETKTWLIRKMWKESI